MSNWQHQMLQELQKQQQVHGGPGAGSSAIGSQRLQLQSNNVQLGTAPVPSLSLASQSIAWQQQQPHQQKFQAQGSNCPAISGAGVQPASSLRQEASQGSCYQEGLGTQHQGTRAQTVRQGQQSSQQWHRPLPLQNEAWQQQQQPQEEKPHWQWEQVAEQSDQWQRQQQLRRQQWEQQQHRQQNIPSERPRQASEESVFHEGDSGAAFFTGVSGKFSQGQSILEKSEQMDRSMLDSFSNRNPGRPEEKPNYQSSSRGTFNRHYDSFKKQPREKDEYGSAYSTAIQSKAQLHSWDLEDLHSKPVFESQGGKFANERCEKSYAGSQKDPFVVGQLESRQQLYGSTRPLSLGNKTDLWQPCYSNQIISEGTSQRPYEQQSGVGPKSRNMRKNAEENRKRDSFHGSQADSGKYGGARTSYEDREPYGEDSWNLVLRQKDKISKGCLQGTKGYRDEQAEFEQQQTTTSQQRDLYGGERQPSGISYCGQSHQPYRNDPQSDDGYHGSQQEQGYPGDQDLRELQETVKQEQGRESWRCCQLCSIHFPSKEKYLSHCSGMMHAQKSVGRCVPSRPKGQDGHDGSLKPEVLYDQCQQAKQCHDSLKTVGCSPKQKVQEATLDVSQEGEATQGEKPSLFRVSRSTQLQTQSLFGVPVSSLAQPSSAARAAMASLASKLGIDLKAETETLQSRGLFSNIHKKQPEKKEMPKAEKQTKKQGSDVKEEKSTVSAQKVLLNCKLCDFVCSGRPPSWDIHCISFQHRKKYLYALSTLGHTEFVRQHGHLSFGELPLEAKSYDAKITDPFERYILHCGIFGKYECRLCWFKCFTVGAWKEHVYGRNHTEKTIQKAKQMGEEKFCQQMCDVPSIYQEKRFRPSKPSMFAIPEGQLEQNIKEMSACKSNPPIPKSHGQAGIPKPGLLKSSKQPIMMKLATATKPFPVKAEAKKSTPNPEMCEAGLRIPTVGSDTTFKPVSGTKGLPMQIPTISSSSVSEPGSVPVGRVHQQGRYCIGEMAHTASALPVQPGASASVGFPQVGVSQQTCMQAQLRRMKGLAGVTPTSQASTSTAVSTAPQTLQTRKEYQDRNLRGRKRTRSQSPASDFLRSSPSFSSVSTISSSSLDRSRSPSPRRKRSRRSYSPRPEHGRHNPSLRSSRDLAGFRDHSRNPLARGVDKSQHREKVSNMEHQEKVPDSKHFISTGTCHPTTKEGSVEKASCSNQMARRSTSRSRKLVRSHSRSRKRSRSPSRLGTNRSMKDHNRHSSSGRNQTDPSPRSRQSPLPRTGQPSSSGDHHFAKTKGMELVTKSYTDLGYSGRPCGQHPYRSRDDCEDEPKRQSFTNEHLRNVASDASRPGVYDQKHACLRSDGPPERFSSDSRYISAAGKELRVAIQEQQALTEKQSLANRSIWPDEGEKGLSKRDRVGQHGREQQHRAATERGSLQRARDLLDLPNRVSSSQQDRQGPVDPGKGRSPASSNSRLLDHLSGHLGQGHATRHQDSRSTEQERGLVDQERESIKQCRRSGQVKRPVDQDDRAIDQDRRLTNPSKGPMDEDVQSLYQHKRPSGRGQIVADRARNVVGHKRRAAAFDIAALDQDRRSISQARQSAGRGQALVDDEQILMGQSQGGMDQDMRWLDLFHRPNSQNQRTADQYQKANDEDIRPCFQGRRPQDKDLRPLNQTRGSSDQSRIPVDSSRRIGVQEIQGPPDQSRSITDQSERLIGWRSRSPAHERTEDIDEGGSSLDRSRRSANLQGNEPMDYDRRVTVQEKGPISRSGGGTAGQSRNRFGRESSWALASSREPIEDSRGRAEGTGHTTQCRSPWSVDKGKSYMNKSEESRGYRQWSRLLENQDRDPVNQSKGAASPNRETMGCKNGGLADQIALSHEGKRQTEFERQPAEKRGDYFEQLQQQQKAKSPILDSREFKDKDDRKLQLATHQRLPDTSHDIKGFSYKRAEQRRGDVDIRSSQREDLLPTASSHRLSSERMESSFSVDCSKPCSEQNSKLDMQQIKMGRDQTEITIHSGRNERKVLVRPAEPSERPTSTTETSKKGNTVPRQVVKIMPVKALSPLAKASGQPKGKPSEETKRTDALPKITVTVLQGKGVGKGGIWKQKSGGSISKSRGRTVTVKEGRKDEGVKDDKDKPTLKSREDLAPLKQRPMGGRTGEQRKESSRHSQCRKYNDGQKSDERHRGTRESPSASKDQDYRRREAMCYEGSSDIDDREQKYSWDKDERVSRPDCQDVDYEESLKGSRGRGRSAWKGRRTYMGKGGSTHKSDHWGDGKGGSRHASKERLKDTDERHHSHQAASQKQDSGGTGILAVSKEFQSALEDFLAAMEKRQEELATNPDKSTEDEFISDDEALADELQEITGIENDDLLKEAVRLLASFPPQVVHGLGSVSAAVIKRLIGCDLSSLRLLGEMNPQVIETLAMMEVSLVIEMADINGMSFILDTLQNMTKADPNVMRSISNMESEEVSKFDNPQDLINNVLQTDEKVQSYRWIVSSRGRGGDLRGNFRAHFFRGAARGLFRGKGRFDGSRGDRRGGSRGGFRESYRDGYQGGYRSDNRDGPRQGYRGGFRGDYRGRHRGGFVGEGGRGFKRDYCD